MNKKSETAKDKKATIGFASVKLADGLRKSSFSGEVASADGSGLKQWGHSECGQASRDKDSDPPSEPSFLDVQRVCAAAGGFLGQTILEHCWRKSSTCRKEKEESPCKNESDPEHTWKLVFDRKRVLPLC